jgi:O-antigen ligase
LDRPITSPPAGAWRLARVEHWLLYTGLFLLPLAYLPDTFDGYVLPKLLVARILVLGLVILFVVRLAATRAFILKRSPLDLPWLAFLASALLSTAFAYNQNVAVFGIYSRYDGMLTILTYAALFWLSRQVIDGPSDARAIFRVLLASGYVVAAIAIIQGVNDSLAYGRLVPALGTLGNSNVLGAFLAMLCPLAYRELAQATSWGARLLAANALVVMGLGLLLTFSRSAWLGALLAAAVLVVGERKPGVRLGLTAGVILVPLLILLAGSTLAGGLSLERDLATRARSALDLSSTSRPHIWLDSVHLIASRPILGYGPDSFGLVFPQFQTGNWEPAIGSGGQQIDKAHAETLQVAATQGLVGLAAYLFILFAFVRTFWRGRQNDGAVAVFAAWLAYEAALQLNFSAPAGALPFWIFAATAVATWTVEPRTMALSIPHPRVATGVAAGLVAALGVLAWLGVAVAFMADVRLKSAVDADFNGRPPDAATLAAQARVLSPFESVYAVEAGNIAFERSNWAAARGAYEDASRLGTYNPMVYRNLALCDLYLGRPLEALAAARKAVELDRFDPANRALLAQFGVTLP